MLELLSTKVSIIDTHYYELYCDIINRCLKENITYETSEKHHILPKSIFPEYKNNDQNIIELCPIDHYNAHKYLALATKNHKLCFAFNMMKNTREENNILNDEEYNLFKENFKNVLSTSAKIQINNAFRDSEKQRSFIQRRWKDPKQFEMQSDFMKANNPMESEASRKKVSDSKIGKSATWMLGDKNHMKSPEYKLKFSGINSPVCKGIMINELTGDQLNLTDFTKYCKMIHQLGGSTARKIYHWFKNGESENEINDVVSQRSKMIKVVSIVSIFNFKEKQYGNK